MNKKIIDKKAVIARTTEIIHELGITPSLRGYQYIRMAVLITVEDFELVHNVTKTLYPEISSRYKGILEVSPSKVERDIRTAINKAWSNGNMKASFKYFKNTINPSTGKPTNTEFIAMIADTIILEMNMEEMIEMM